MSTKFDFSHRQAAALVVLAIWVGLLCRMVFFVYFRFILKRGPRTGHFSFLPLKTMGVVHAITCIFQFVNGAPYFHLSVASLCVVHPKKKLLHLPI